MKKVMMLITLLSLQPMAALAITVSDYLVDADIGQYSKSYPGACPKGTGILAGVSHFKIDHTDYACDIHYYNETSDFGVEVQVTKHSGSDSDKWLMHEVDTEFRTYYGIPDPSYIIKTINGNTIYTFGTAGWDYRWVSGNKVIMIEYHDTQMNKPEPLEIVQAYLAKHPSTLPMISMKDLYSSAGKTTWIKDEMERRLWFCDKWFYQLQLKKVEEKQVYQESVKSMNIFLDYREKYYGIKAINEKNILASYLYSNNGTGIKAKLTEYKNWWSVNKDKAISL